MTTIRREQLHEVVHTLPANADVRLARVPQISKRAELGFILQQTKRNLRELATLS